MRNPIKHIITFKFFTLLLVSTSFAGRMGFPTIDDYQERAYQYGVEITIPDFPTTVGEIETATKIILQEINASGDKIANLPDEDVAFENTIAAIDHIRHSAYSKTLPINVVKNTSPDVELRDAATEAMKKLNQASIAFNYREDIYLKLKAFADLDPILSGEDQLLFEKTMLEYKRLGYDLPAEERADAEALQKKLSDLNTNFGDNIRNSNDVLAFTAEELKGLPESFLETVKNEKGLYEIKPNITHHALTVYTYADSEAIRKKVYTSRSMRALDTNLEIMQDMIRTRHALAKKLGYTTWADYRTEDRMAGTGDRVSTFLEGLVDKLEPKFQEEMELLRALKVAETGRSEAEINIWDVHYYREKQNKLKFDLVTEEIKQYFPYEKCVQGLFEVYERVFSIEITEIENPTLWDANVSLYIVTDTESEKPLGLFYMDPFPREGKFNHFAQFTIIPAAELPGGKYQRPTVALICNFPSPTENKPSLLTFDHVETLFHEFGHGMHSILTEAKYSRFSGTSVPRDFVEAPSQVMEYWLTDKAVLDLFAAHWEDQTKKFPAEWVEKLNMAAKANAGMHYRRQLAFGSMDMAIHNVTDAETVAENVKDITNGILAKVYLPAPEGTGMITSFGHMAGYDAGYYGYAWADVIAADMAKVFQTATDGYMDETVGHRLRKEIFEVGASRDVNESVQAFLGREVNMDAFIESLGVKPDTDQAEES